MSRLAWVDYAKGIGILLVVYGHVLRGIHSANMGLSETYFEISDKIVYGFHMPLFFFLSGLFVEKWKAKGFRIGLNQKLKTIVYPYFLWSLIQGVIIILLSSYTNNSMNWSDLINGILYDPIAQFWFLYALFLMFMMYFLLRKIMGIPKVLMVSTVLYFITPFIDFHILNKFSFNFIFFVAGAFLMNMNLDMLLDKLKSKYILSSLFGFLLTNAVYLTLDELTDFNLHIFKLLLAIIGIAFIVCVSVSLDRSHKLKVLNYIGSLSMVIFLIHILVASGSRIILNRVFNIHDLTIHIFLGTLLGIAVPIICYKITNYLGINGIAFGMFKKNVKDNKGFVA